MKELADAAGLGRQHIYLIESGASERSVNAVTLSKALRVTMGKLFTGREAA